MNGFPTSSDIYIELDGKRVAVVQSYASRSQKKSTPVEAFGEDQPVATSVGQPTHTVELERLYVTDSAIKDGITFYDMDNFSLVIVKPDRKIYYTGCRWSDIQEDAALGDMVMEKVTVVAAARSEEKR